jgi:hypothetical protein
VLLTVAVLVAAVAVCGGGSVLVANMLGLVGCEPKPAYVSEVQDDVRRVTALFPAIAFPQPTGSAGAASGSPGSSSPTPGASDGNAGAGQRPSASPSASAVSGIITAHYQFRDARRHTCPEISTVLTIYDGLAELTPARAEALKTEYRFTPAEAPSVPDDLQRFAPANAAWQRSDGLDKAATAKVWFDAASRTAFFTYLTD